MQGQTFDAVRRLEIATQKSSGLGRIAALRALSAIVEEQPDLEKVLGFEKRALSAGKRWFKRKRISESAGLKPAKEGAEIWEGREGRIVWNGGGAVAPCFEFSITSVPSCKKSDRR